jgi:hypothetical protein
MGVRAGWLVCPGRLLIPFLRASLEVDGCDVSAEMLAYCKETAEREGLSPRRDQTIVVCGVFGRGINLSFE